MSIEMENKLASISEEIIDGLPRLGVTKVYLAPMNDGQEFGYMNSYTGTAKEIIDECQRLLLGLDALLPYGNFQIRINNYELPHKTKIIIVDTEDIFDAEFKPLTTIEEFYKNAR